ncbi:3-hydroxy-3-methylglutaryl-coenzyme A reductase [Pseudolycoriella hygida]|uniref:3-hydroxy-3-methylglutaryl coenzyme A reductase n=1 Tax=Pseudolycoriella hygida TaxID=35572 RepID=A0A9Q0RY80_9DIPT|nr:3-hydroxy-3-methylglutaryl-coenzyme A reductase [Pseudolycoriella hygida]
MICRLFRAHGEFCASHPWEVIVALLTLTACILTVDKTSENTSTARQRQCQGWRDSCEGFEAEYNAADVILMTIVRCSAVLYSYYQFLNLHKFGSKYILGIAGLFTVFSSFIFTSSVINFLGSEVSDLKDALFFFLLLIDLSKAGYLAQLALRGSNPSEVTLNIARGMELLGPAISLDTLVETLVIGVGTLSGVHRLEVLCGFAVMSVVVNYVVFMTFYPACLSLIMDLSRNGVELSKVKERAKDSLALHSFTEEDHKPNPVVQRVKVIMSTGLMLVHAYSRFVFTDKDPVSTSGPLHLNQQHSISMNRTEPSDVSGYIMKWLTMSADQIVILILLIALLVKFIFFEDREDLADQLRQQQQQQVAASTQVDANKLQLETTSAEVSNNVPKKMPMFTISDIEFVDRSTQTDFTTFENDLVDVEQQMVKLPPRKLEECLLILSSDDGASALTDEEITEIVRHGGGHCPLYKIESIINDPERGVKVRRQIVSVDANLPLDTLNSLSYKHFDYTKVMNACCENVLGYVQIPVGYAGPLLLDGCKYFVPMATTEGALVASTNRGCKALSVRGVSSFVEDIGMTRAPCVKFPSVLRASLAKRWIEQVDNFKNIKIAFDSTSRFARLQEVLIAMDGPQLYIRFRALTGDAMGMNMVSKGAEMALRYIHKAFPDMQIISLSGNFCSDKKPAAINWIKGRGKRVVCECIIPADKLKSILKTDAKTLVQCNKLKNMAGSAMAGSIGGNNAHAANMVTAVFIACGQDPAQNVTSSNCSTGMELYGDSGEDLYLTCTMPSLEVGTVGGGTGLPGQSACLGMLGVRGAHKTHPAENAKTLAKIICATVMAGELSLMAALVNSDLVKSHMRHNRSSVAVNPDFGLSQPILTTTSSNTTTLNTSST